MSVDEMVEELRAMLADRHTSERQRTAITMAIRLAVRGKHISSTRLPAVSSATQNFVRAREMLDAGLSQIANVPPYSEDDEPDDDPDT